MPTLEISLKKLDVYENGSVEKEREAYFSAVLFFPRSGVAQVISARKLPPLTDTFTLDLDQPNPATERPFSWAEKVLFKEEIVGQAYLVVHVKTGKGAAEKFLDGLVKGLFGAAAGTIASPYVGVLAGSLIGQLFPESKEDETEVVGAGEFDLDAEAITGPTLKTIDLYAPTAITRNGFVLEGGKPVKKPFALLEKGQRNGSVEIRMKPV